MLYGTDLVDKRSANGSSNASVVVGVAIGDGDEQVSQPVAVSAAREPAHLRTDINQVRRSCRLAMPDAPRCSMRATAKATRPFVRQVFRLVVFDSVTQQLRLTVSLVTKQQELTRVRPPKLRR